MNLRALHCTVSIVVLLAFVVISYGLVTPVSIPANIFQTATINQGQFHYYRFSSTQSRCAVTLITTAGDADLYVSTNAVNPDQRSHMVLLVSSSLIPPGFFYSGFTL